MLRSASESRFHFARGVNHLGPAVTKVEDRERDGAFHSVEVIVDTGSLQYEQRSSYAGEFKFGSQILLEIVFDEFYASFGLFLTQNRFVSFRNNQVAHMVVPWISSEMGKSSFFLYFFRYKGNINN